MKKPIIRATNGSIYEVQDFKTDFVGQEYILFGNDIYVKQADGDYKQADKKNVFKTHSLSVKE